MAVTSSTEKDILELLELRQYCTQSLSDEIVRRIRLIREKCQQSEKNETSESNGQFAWRRGGSSSGYNGGSSSANGATNKIHHKNTSYPISNQWRGQSVQQSIPIKSTLQSRQGSSLSEKVPGRYVSKFTNSSSPVEDKILNQVILNKLNKFSQSNYNEVKEFLQQILDSNESNFLRDFMLLVFKKAASEPTFCPLYARMISELSVKYTSLLTELENLYLEYLTIFEEVNEDQCKDYEQFVQKNREKLHRLGYSQFLGELTSVGVLNQTQIIKLYTTLFEQIKTQASLGDTKQSLVEEYVDCLLRMSKAFQKGKTIKLINLRKEIGTLCEPIMEDILAKRDGKYPGLSKKASFGIMDCLDIFRGNTVS
jgi:hypothetical protein